MECLAVEHVRAEQELNDRLNKLVETRRLPEHGAVEVMQAWRMSETREEAVLNVETATSHLAGPEKVYLRSVSERYAGLGPARGWTESVHESKKQQYVQQTAHAQASQMITAAPVTQNRPGFNI